MAALATERNTPALGSDAVVDRLSCPIAASTKIFQGSLVGINGSGYLEPAAAGSNKQLKIIGRAKDTVDNTAGTNGAKSVEVDRGTFKWDNSAATDAVTQADFGRIVYAVDDHTVARTPAFGARPPAGRVMGVDADGSVWVDSTQTTDSEFDFEVLCAAGADLSGSQFFFVKQNTSNQVVLAAAGEGALGVLQNAPANAAIAIVKILGKTRIIAGAAITQGAFIASDAAGKAKAAARLTQATGAGSHCLGRALTAAGADTNPFEAVLLHAGLLPTTDA